MRHNHSHRVALFIDGPNLYATARALNFDIDYRKLLSEFQSRGVLIRASYYTAIADSEDYAPVRPLADWLQYNGYALVSKKAKEYVDSQGRRRWRGDMDVEIACDMIEMATNADHLFLFAGNGNFCRVVDVLQRRGARVTVVSSIKSSPPMISDELRKCADTFLDLADLMPLVSRLRA